jgi:hypothetical protein
MGPFQPQHPAILRKIQVDADALDEAVVENRLCLQNSIIFPRCQPLDGIIVLIATLQSSTQGTGDRNGERMAGSSEDV